MTHLLLIASLLVVEPPPEVQRAKDALPEHQLRKCGGTQYMCFDFEPFKDLLGQSHERLTLLEERDLFGQKFLLMFQKITALEATLEVRDKQLATWKADHARLLEKWKTENELRHKAEMRANSPWPVITMVVGSLVGVSGALWGAFNPEEPAPWILTGTGVVVTTVAAIDFVF